MALLKLGNSKCLGTGLLFNQIIIGLDSQQRALGGPVDPIYI